LKLGRYSNGGHENFEFRSAVVCDEVLEKWFFEQNVDAILANARNMAYQKVLFMRCPKPYEEAEDAAQVAVKEALNRGLENFDNPQHLIGWVVTTAKNRFWDAERRSGRRREAYGKKGDIDKARRESDGLETPETAAVQRERADKIHNAMRVMNENCKEMLSLHTLGLSKVEIAEKMGVPGQGDGPRQRIGRALPRCMSEFRRELLNSHVDPDYWI
jgi:RNA polymerase sigma factor (sigma-70 family)